jgi:hypothetical protein
MLHASLAAAASAASAAIDLCALPKSRRAIDAEARQTFVYRTENQYSKQKSLPPRVPLITPLIESLPEAPHAAGTKKKKKFWYTFELNAIFLLLFFGVLSLTSNQILSVAKPLLATCNSATVTQ